MSLSYCHRIRCSAVIPQIQYCRVGKLHGKSSLYNLSGIQCNLHIILKHTDDHLIVRSALTFQMVFLFSYSDYLKTGIRYFLFCTGILSLDKVFIRIKEYFFISPVIFSTSLITGMIRLLQSFSSVRNTSSYGVFELVGFPLLIPFLPFRLQVSGKRYGQDETNFCCKLFYQKNNWLYRKSSITVHSVTINNLLTNCPYFTKMIQWTMHY